MPLHILVAMVVVGLSVVALLLHFTGRSRLRLLTEQDARDQWLRQYPEDQISEVTLARDGHSAVLQTNQGPGLLWSFGADTVARHLHDFDVSETGTGLTVRFAEYAVPRVSLTLSPDERPRWKQMMEPQ